jgi:hypothetical protein
VFFLVADIQFMLIFFATHSVHVCTRWTSLTELAVHAVNNWLRITGGGGGPKMMAAKTVATEILG